MDGLLIDWGGVLTTSLIAAFDAFSAREGLGEHAVREAFKHQPDARQALIDLESGEISLPEFEQRLGAALNVDPDGLARRLTADLRPDPAMRDAVRRYRDAGIRTALVSNSWRRDDYADLDAFDVTVLSQEVGVRKPDERIYRIALDRLGLPAERCVFVDDLGGNLKPAKALGMTTIRHEIPANTVSQLDRLLLARSS
ncbi:MAG TPA: HAD family phosphatase [Solirubrobacter sp.]|jgi:epoxide hydrolase-like predicted phosphatase|nr:HAD family phosphatase [Solirubrobacter sp.]